MYALDDVFLVVSTARHQHDVTLILLDSTGHKCWHHAGIRATGVIVLSEVQSVR